MQEYWMETGELIQKRSNMYLNAGTGCACAGQESEIAALASLVSVRLSVPKENLGFVPPMGSNQD